MNIIKKHLKKKFASRTEEYTKELEQLGELLKNNEINGEIVLVVSNRKKAYGLERARLANIKAECIKDDDLLIKRLEEENDESIEITDDEIDLDDSDDLDDLSIVNDDEIEEDM